MKKILVGVDFSKNTSKVVDQVALLARGLKAKVWIVHVTSDQLKTDICPTAQLYGFPIASITPPISNYPNGSCVVCRRVQTGASGIAPPF